MKVLFINYDCGCAVERTGEINIEILSRFKGIEKIFVWRSQCLNEHKNLSEFLRKNKIDLVITEDGKLRSNEILKFIECPIITFLHGGEPQNYFDLIFCLNPISYAGSNDPRFIPLNPYVGNIWKPLNEKRRNEFIFVGRFYEEKCILDEFIEKYYDKYGKLKIYGIADKNYLEKHSKYVEYMGLLKSPKEVLKVYNKFEYIWVHSKSECIANSLREALLCKCIPFVNEHVLSNVLDLSEFLVFEGKNVESVKRKIDKFYSVIKMKHSMEDNIVRILLALRGILLKDLKWNGEKCAEIIEMNKSSSTVKYSSEIIEWDKLEL